MGQVISADGTPIAYDRTGDGSPVVLISGGLDDGSENSPLAATLAPQFSVLNYARRGRGRSGDAPEYLVEREFEDLAAIIGLAGEPALVYGTSSGGALALEAAAAGVPGIAKIAVYEVPYNMSADWPARWSAYVDALSAAVSSGAPGSALELFLRLTGASDQDVEAARLGPFWSASVALEHTLAYDAACLGTGRPDPERLAGVHQPALVLTGDGHTSPQAAPWVVALDEAADAITAALPHATRQVLAGQSHVPDPHVLADVLTGFFRS